MDTTLTVTVVIKGDRHAAINALTERLNIWFLEDVQTPAPYPTGSLLYWHGEDVRT